MLFGVVGQCVGVTVAISWNTDSRKDGTWGRRRCSLYNSKKTGFGHTYQRWSALVASSILALVMILVVLKNTGIFIVALTTRVDKHVTL